MLVDQRNKCPYIRHLLIEANWEGNAHEQIYFFYKFDCPCFSFRNIGAYSNMRYASSRQDHHYQQDIQPCTQFPKNGA